MVNLASDKMAKSLGNILDVQRAVELHGRNAIRMWLLQSHYSQPIDYSEEILEEKKRSYERLRNLYTRIADSTCSSYLDKELAIELYERFDAAMRDDFNTPEAIAALFEAAGKAGQEISTRPQATGDFSNLKDALAELLFLLGFTLPVESQKTTVGSEITLRWRTEESADRELPQQVRKMIVEREQARREKDWALADRLRDELHAEGWIVEDTPEGPVLSRR